MLGGGLQGVCVALAAARLGLRVDLFDHQSAPMLGASLHNEGKLHLGFVYAGDPSRGTHRLMASGALSFGRVLRVLTGLDPSLFVTGSTFTYGLAADSQVSANAFDLHCSAVMDFLQPRMGPNGVDYLGRTDLRPCEQLDADALRRAFDTTNVTAAWSTPELAVDTRRLALALRQMIRNHPSIRFRGGCDVLAASESSQQIVVDFRDTSTARRERFDAVVNCLWDGRVAVDETFGIPVPASILFRYKAYLRFDSTPLTEDILPSTTLVHGPYGDLINCGNGHYFLSWYPTFRLGSTGGRDARSLHRLLDGASPMALLDSGVTNLSRFVPALGQLRERAHNIQIGGGVIVARGQSDIDDSDSELHERTAIGPEQYGRYITVETGKFTTAPMFAERVQRCLASMFGLEEAQ